MTDNKQTDAAMKRRLWIRQRQHNAFFAHRPRIVKFWDFVGKYFKMSSYHDSRGINEN